jgi:hypothetical protein
VPLVLSSGICYNPSPSIQWVPGALSLGVKRPEREADHSLQSSAEVKNGWSYTSIPQIPSWNGAQIRNFTFTYYGNIRTTEMLYTRFHQNISEYCKHIHKII